MKKLLVLLFIIVCTSVIAQEEQHYQALFNEANQLYIDNNYAEAKNKYEQIIALNIESAELYYNLANCYYKLASYPSSILYYEKALVLNPNNEDIKFNLAVANQNITDNIDKLPTIFYESWWNSLVNVANLKQWTKISIYCAYLFCIALCFFFFIKIENLKRLSFYLAIFICFIFAISIVVSLDSKTNLTNENYAIIFSASLNVKSAPVSNSTNLFVLHEGTKVKIIQSSGKWIEISLEDGNIGWIENQNISII